MTDLAKRISLLFVTPEGSNRTWLNLLTSTFTGTPYWSESETIVAKQSMRPESVEPSLDMVIKISPGWPSSNNPTVKYPSCPATENLCVMAWRSSARRRRYGVPATALVLSLPPLLVESGWTFLEPSREAAAALIPSRHHPG